MRLLLYLCACFTFAASAWLTVMYVTLGHPGFEWRAVLSLAVLAQSALTVAALRRPTTRGVRAVLLAGACALLWIGGAAILANESGANRHWEAYVTLIGAACVVQGLMTLWVVGCGLLASTDLQPSLS